MKFLSNNKLYIRVDGSFQIGVGHLMRCTALAYMLKDNFDIIFFCKEIPDQIRKELSENGFSCNLIENESEFIRNLDKKTFVVLDGYHFDTEFQKKIKDAGSKLICIDDLHDKEFVADLIINHSPGITPHDYKTLPYSQFALGLNYVLLRPVFLKQAKKKRIINKLDTLLICFGGSDYKNLTYSTLKTSMEFSEFKKIIVVTGAAFQFTEDIIKLTNYDKRIVYRQMLNEEQMLNTMLSADVAIVPSSGILLEALAAGSIVISGKYVDNQILLYKEIKSINGFFDADDFSQQKIQNAIHNVFKSNKTPLKVITGNSSVLLNKFFIELLSEDNIFLRKVNPLDLTITFKWANNSEIRRYSFQKKQISLQEHTRWFLDKIADGNCYFFIAEYNNKPIGSIRFDIVKEEAVISYLLDSKFQGKGLGKVLLIKGIKQLLLQPEIQPISLLSGSVMKTNIASIKSFQKLGFLQLDKDDYLKFEKRL